jgi:DNA-binding NarL/FixJ family response regulator
MLAERPVRTPAHSDAPPARAVPPTCVSLLIATPDEVLRDGLRSTFRDTPAAGVIGMVGNGRAAIAGAERRRPDVALVDLRLCEPSGIETAAIIARTAPHCRVLLYLDRHDPQVMRRAWAAGVTSYLLKGASHETIRDAVQTVAAGGAYVDPQLAGAMREIARNPLTRRELAILELVSHGHSNNAVAARLEITEQTVKTHMRSILAKLQADCRTHAVSMGIRTGLIA